MLLLPSAVGRLQPLPHSFVWREILLACPNPVFTCISLKATKEVASPVPAPLARQLRQQKRCLGPWGPGGAGPGVQIAPREPRLVGLVG